MLQRISGVTIMRYINLHFTYLLTYLLTYLNFVMYKTNMENEKNNVTSRYAETYTTVNCKT